MPHRALAKTPLLSFVLVSLALAAGCGKSPADKLAGKWVGDRIDNVSADDVARATGWVKGTSFEFAGDKMTVTIPSEPARKGTFKVAKAEGEKMTLAISRGDDKIVGSDQVRSGWTRRPVVEFASEKRNGISG